jgi:hypothetical protein
MLLAGCCTPLQQLANGSPAAKTPLLTSISSVVPRSGAWTAFTPDASGNVMLLPSGHPNGDIRIVFQAPYPSSITADIGGIWVLREFDNSQGYGEGYYRINSIAQDASQTTFNWDVTFTPPGSSRVETSFQLNVKNVSVNGTLSGTDKTSAPLTLTFTRPPVPDLDAWLNANTTVRDAIVWEAPGGASSFHSWTAQNADFLRTTFAGAWNTIFPLINDPPPNQITLADTDDPKTGLSEGDAWPLFVSHVAYSLAGEIGGWTGWSITGYSSDQLAILLDSREMFQWDGGANAYVIHEGSSFHGVVPASPWTTLLFLYESGIYTCRSRIAVIDAMLNWCRANLMHFAGAFEAKNMQDQWQYRGCPPVLRMIEGTPFPAGPAGTSGIHHRTAGCWGTTGFLRAVLRVLNIPVQHDEHQGHSMPNFLTEGLYLDHADDPYNRLTTATPPFSAHELLIDQATHDAWFGNGVSNMQQLANVGRRTREVAVKYLSDELLRNRCADMTSGSSHAASQVAATLALTFSVADLEAQDLWTKLDAKIANLGGCTKVPQG